APVMKMVFDMPSSLRRCSPTGQGGLFVGPAVPPRELRHRAQWQCACLRQPPRDDVACLAGPALTRSGRAAGAWAAALLGPAARGRGGTRRYFGRLRGQAGARPRDHAFRASGAGTGLCSAAERRGARPPVPARGAAGAAAQPGHRSDPGGNTTAADQAGRYSGRRLRRRLEPGVVEPARGRALGRATTPSEQVVRALACALRLSAEERDHLYRLAGLQAPQHSLVIDQIPAGTRRLLTRLADIPVAVFAADWSLVWWNQHWAAL